MLELIYLYALIWIEFISELNQLLLALEVIVVFYEAMIAYFVVVYE